MFLDLRLDEVELLEAVVGVIGEQGRPQEGHHLLLLGTHIFNRFN